MAHPGVYHLNNGLVGYGAGVGRVDVPGDPDGDICLILSIEVDEDGGTWAHILRWKHAERVPGSHVVHLKEPPSSARGAPEVSA